MEGKQFGFIINPGDFRMQDWLLKAEISSGAKLTYSVLACCAGGRDFVWPSQEFLAEKVSVSVRTVQRYLNELIRFGLIEKCKQYIKGQVRNTYRFLCHAITGVTEKIKAQNVAPLSSIQSSDRHDNLSPRSPEAENFSSTDTTICPDRHDKMSPSLNKEETIKGNIYPPPTPQEDVPVAQVEGTCEVTGKGGGLFLESNEEDPDWIKAKDILKNEISPGSFQTWIAPLLFARNGSTVILRGHNNFFSNWVKTHFSAQIEAALGQVGLTEWQLDIFTPEQQKADAERKARDEELQKEAARTAAKATAPPDEDVDALPLDEQFERLYAAYPKKRQEARHQAWKTFSRLFWGKCFPKFSDLLNAVKRHCAKESWQREDGQYAPQLHRWLSEKRWLD